IGEAGGDQPVGHRPGEREPPLHKQRRDENRHSRHRDPERHGWCAGQVSADDQLEHAGDPENRHQQLEPVLICDVPEASHPGNVPLFKALNVCLTVGLVWQFVLVATLVWREQRTFRWSILREALWLRSPRSPRSGRVGGRIWLIVIPLIVATLIESMIPLGGPADRDFGAFLGSHAGKAFMHGAWGWYALILVWFVFNTVLGEELLFRGFLLPRMNGVFKRKDWLANGVLFAAYHLHFPWAIPGTLAIDPFAVAY